MSSCESDLVTWGLYKGEEILTAIRIIATLIAATVTSAWCSLEKIRRLRLFFAHWLSGLVACLGYLVENAMVTDCWTGSAVVDFIKTLKYVELASFNMFALTNLAVCVNLALIVSAQLSRVKSVSSPPQLLVFLAISLALAVPLVLLTETIFVSASGFHPMHNDEEKFVFLVMAHFYVEFFVGICMFFIVAWLLLFRMEAVKDSWKIHARIRFYFGLTLVGIAVNLGIGISGTINVLADEIKFVRIVWSWCFRYIHIALDTIVLYGVLRERSTDERCDGNITGSGSGGLNLPSGRRGPSDGVARGSGRSNSTSKPVSFTPPPCGAAAEVKAGEVGDYNITGSVSCGTNLSSGRLVPSDGMARGFGRSTSTRKPVSSSVSYGVARERSMDERYGVLRGRNMDERYGVRRERSIDERYGVLRGRNMDERYGVLRGRNMDERYGVRRERNTDELGDDDITGSVSRGNNVPSGQRVLGDGMARVSGRSNSTSKTGSFNHSLVV